LQEECPSTYDVSERAFTEPKMRHRGSVTTPGIKMWPFFYSLLSNRWADLISLLDLKKMETMKVQTPQHRLLVLMLAIM
jgi:hypothetical protein